MYQATYILSDYLHSLGAMTGVSGGIWGLAAGLLLLLFGYKLKRIALVVVGISLGFTGGVLLAEHFFMDNVTMQVVIVIVCALAGAVLAGVVYRVALYLMGAAAGAAVGYFLAVNYIPNLLWGIVIAVVLAIVVGILASVIERPIIIIVSAFLGYLLFRIGLYLLLHTDESLVIEVVSLVLLVACIIFQFLTGKRKDDRYESRKRRVSGEEELY